MLLTGKIHDFFDLIDRRYNKEGNFNMIFTSNKNPALWRENLEEDAALLCTLARIFDDATVCKLHDESFRGKKFEVVSLQTGKAPAVELVAAREQTDYSLQIWIIGILFSNPLARILPTIIGSKLPTKYDWKLQANKLFVHWYHLHNNNEVRLCENLLL